MSVPTSPRRLLLVGWAGADWRLIQPLVDAGRMPHLESLITQGISGKIVTQTPMVPPALWTSVATGRRADAHGILGHTMPDSEGLGVRPVTSVDLRAAPVWQILNAEGRSAAAVGWPVTHPATVFDCLVVSDAFAEARGADFDTWPVLAHSVSDLKLIEALREVRLHPSEVTAEQVLPFIPQAGRVDQETDHRLPLLAATLSRAATIHGAATWIVEHQPWDLLAVHFDLIERLSTAFLQYRAPRMPHVTTVDFEIYGDVVDGAYQFMDLLLGRYLSLVGRDAHVLLISDHGFQIDHLRPPPNALLVGDPVARRYRELGVLVCRGPGVKKDELVFGATLLDVAPTALALLGVPASREMEGRVLAQIFEEPGTAASVDRHAAPVLWDRARDWEDKDWAVGRIIELVALGYLPPVAADPSAAGNQAIVQRLSNLARVLMAKREHRRALTVLGDVLDLDPERLEARFEVARCWYALDEASRCREALDDIAASGVCGPVVDFLRGQLCAKEGNLAAAAIYLESAEEASVGDWRLLEQIGRVHLNAQQFMKAEQSFRNALDIDPNFAQAHSGLGTALINQQRHEEAIDHLRRSIGLLFHQPDAHVNLGLSLAAVGRSVEAADAMRQALVIQPDFPQARVALHRIEDVMAKRMIEAVMKTV